MYSLNKINDACRLAKSAGVVAASNATGISKTSINKWLKEDGIPTKMVPGTGANDLGRKATDAEIAWASGIFEGEGAITIRTYPQGWTFAYLIVCMTDKDVIERFASIVGCGRITNYDGNRRRAAHHKPRFDWQCTKHDDVGYLLAKLLPWLGIRRRARAWQAYSEVNNSLAGRISKRSPGSGPRNGTNSKQESH